MAHKVLFVPACFGAMRETRKVHVPTGEKKRLLGMKLFEYDQTVQKTVEVEGKRSDCVIDGAALARDLEAQLDALEAEGFEVRQVIGVSSGAHHHEIKEHAGTKQGSPWGYGYGYGFSYTEGVLVVGSK